MRTLRQRIYVTFQFLQMVLLLKLNGFTLLLEASTIISSKNLSTMTKPANYLFLFSLQVPVGEKSSVGEGLRT